MSVHQIQTGIEPMIMMGMVDNINNVNVNNASTSNTTNTVEINISANRASFPTSEAHPVVPNTIVTMPSQQSTQVQQAINHTNSAIVAQLLQPPLQLHQPIVQQIDLSVMSQAQAPVQIQTIALSNAEDTMELGVSKSKKARKKKSDASGQKKKPDVKLKVKKKKSVKPKLAKAKPKKPSEGSVSLLGKKGKTLDAQAREIALNVAEYFKREADLGQTLLPFHSYQKRAAAATGISTATLRKLEGARREIKSERLIAERMVDNPFPDLEIADSTFLDVTDFRHKCKKCNKSRKYFCYICCSPNPHIVNRLPKVKLPVKIDIIKHQTEVDGRSTCPQAVLLAPDDVSVYTFPYIPDYDKEKVVLVYPGTEASTIKELVRATGSSTATIIAVSNSAPAPSADPDTGMDTSTAPTPMESGLHTPRPDQVSGAGTSGYTDMSGSSTLIDLQTIWTNAYFPQPGPSGGMQSAGGLTYLHPVQLFHNQDFATQQEKETVDSQDSNREMKPMIVVNPPFERAIFIDCPWNQTKTVLSDERLKDLRRVEIKGHNTQFWRCQENLPSTHLSTIEAIYYFVQEYHEEVLGVSYLNEYDNLLFFFLHFYHKVRGKYKFDKTGI